MHRYIPCVFGLIHSSRRSVILDPYEVQFVHGMRMLCLPHKRRRSTLVTCRAWITLGASIITSWTRACSNAAVNENLDKYALQDKIKVRWGGIVDRDYDNALSNFECRSIIYVQSP